MYLYNHNAYVCLLLQVVVHGLPFAYAWQDLKDLFKPLGGVHIAEIVMDRNTARSRGWGTVTFDTESDAQNAIQVGCCCNGNSLRVVHVLHLRGSTVSFCVSNEQCLVFRE